MTIVVGIPACTDPGEHRVPMVPDVVKKLKALGVDVVIQRGASKGAFISEADMGDVIWVDTNQEILDTSDVLWVVQAPEVEMIGRMRPGTIVIGLLQPFGSVERVQAFQASSITAFAMELLPRISRAQSMDILSSQASASGYQCVLMAASRTPKFFPMLTYAAGTIRPAKVLVIGAGVAGLQAIATAKRLGAVVSAYDVRPETREQIESLGAKWVDTGVTAVGTGGYARDLTDDEKAEQAGKLAKAISDIDVLITTAAVPGKRAPVIVTDAMVQGMRTGAVVVDMAAEQGGNVEGTIAGKEVKVGPARLVGPINLPSRMPVHTSEMFAKNLLNFFTPMVQEGLIKLDWDDAVVAGTTLTHGGDVKSDLVRKVLGLEEPQTESATTAQPDQG